MDAFPIFTEMALLLLLAAVIGAVGTRLRQPLIVAFIAVGMTPIAALYVAVALTFFSTIIIVKLLSDKRELDTLHGRIYSRLLR